MTFMPWTDELLVGIRQIDEQHHWLVDKTNQLHDELNKPQPDNAVISEIIEGLVDYTMNHFIVEEELFQRFGYPETPAHKKEHDKFTTKAMELLQKHEGGTVVSNETLEFLKDWLIHHIMKVDKAYTPFLKERGIS